jgi:hypothetical protein
MHLTGITFDFTTSIPGIIHKEEYLARLIGALTKFTKTQAATPGDFDDDFDDENEFCVQLAESLPREVRGLVYEIQIHLLCGMTHAGRVETARGLCDKALREYEEFGLRRIRVLERYLYLAVVGGEDTAKFVEMGLSAISQLTSTKVPALDLSFLFLIVDIHKG